MRFSLALALWGKKEVENQQHFQHLLSASAEPPI